MQQEASPHQPKVVPILFDSYLAVIKNSLGANTFRNYYALVDGVKTDVMKNGEFSCALFASSVLALFSLLKKPHATVDGTLKAFEEEGWEIIHEPKTGCVLIWEKDHANPSEQHRHIGFYMDAEKAISNSSDRGFPVEHHWTFGIESEPSFRRIEAIYWNSRLTR